MLFIPHLFCLSVLLGGLRVSLQEETGTGGRGLLKQAIGEGFTNYGICYECEFDFLMNSVFLLEKFFFGRMYV